MYTLALAYAGTSNNDAVRKLLHIAVSDTSDDVRRAAVTSLAFLLFKNPSQVPRIVQLLSESYNPHVRCGATLALGIACAGTGLQDAVDILEPMTKDSVDFVRQGAFIALGMVLVQQSEAASPSMAPTRALYAKIVADKHEDPMARFGAALGQGFIDAGGRNVTISLQSRAGTKNTSAIVGMVLFCQFWYWYPLAHCACLAFEPTGIIGLSEDLKVTIYPTIARKGRLTLLITGAEVRFHLERASQFIRLPSHCQTAEERGCYESCDRRAIDHREGQGAGEEKGRCRRGTDGHGEHHTIARH